MQSVRDQIACLPEMASGATSMADPLADARLNSDASLKNVWYFNCEGIRFLQQNDTQEAINFFHHAIKVLRLDLDNDENVMEVTQEYEQSLAGRRLVASIEVPEHRSAASPDGVFSLFNRALYWNENAQLEKRTRNLLITGILVYNLGLAYNIEGLIQGHSRKVAKAHGMYLMAYNTFLSLRDSTSIFLLPFLSIINNLGHIHAYFQDYDEATRCQQEMSRRMMSLALPTPPDAEPCLSEGEYMICFLNICLFEKEMFSAPVA
jgi:tetratricopeptide (TPR) repeat protein